MENTQTNFENEVTRCKKFICNNFLQMPSPRSVSVYSLFFSGGTFTDEEVIKKALLQITPEQLYKRH
jgi:hypothetical protein